MSQDETREVGGGQSIELSTCVTTVKEFGFYYKDNKEPEEFSECY